jgi:stage II sporulation protein GA (sporulation sigma-E factor processing peptidase)
VNNYIFQLEFEIQDKKYNFKSFLDTGNELREPITNLPCILIEKNLIEDINFDCNNTYHILYDSIGYGGELKGVRINNVKLNSNKFLDKKIDAIICPCTEKLSKENEFNALLSRGVV